MTVFTCNHDIVSIFSCVYDAMKSRLGHENIKLMYEPILQCSFLDEYVHVEPDYDKAEKVTKAIQNKISTYVYREITYCTLSNEENALDNLYRVLLLGFAYGKNVLDMEQYEAIYLNRRIRKSVKTEICHFQEFSRFHQIRGNARDTLYIAHIEPHARVVMALGPAFMDRMPSENWMIVDDINKEAVVHPKDEMYYLKTLSDDDIERLLLTEMENDEYTDLWKLFFDNIAIKERKNEKCQNTLMPKWTRKHAVEWNMK